MLGALCQPVSTAETSVEAALAVAPPPPGGPRAGGLWGQGAAGQGAGEEKCEVGGRGAHPGVLEEDTEDVDQQEVEEQEDVGLLAGEALFAPRQTWETESSFASAADLVAAPPPPPSSSAPPTTPAPTPARGNSASVGAAQPVAVNADVVVGCAASMAPPQHGDAEEVLRVTLTDLPDTPLPSPTPQLPPHAAAPVATAAAAEGALPAAALLGGWSAGAGGGPEPLRSQAPQQPWESDEEDEEEEGDDDRGGVGGHGVTLVLPASGNGAKGQLDRHHHDQPEDELERSHDDASLRRPSPPPSRRRQWQIPAAPAAPPPGVPAAEAAASGAASEDDGDVREEGGGEGLLEPSSWQPGPAGVRLPAWADRLHSHLDPKLQHEPTWQPQLGSPTADPAGLAEEELPWGAAPPSGSASTQRRLPTTLAAARPHLRLHLTAASADAPPPPAHGGGAPLSPSFASTTTAAQQVVALPGSDAGRLCSQPPNAPAPLDHPPQPGSSLQPPAERVVQAAAQHASAGDAAPSAASGTSPARHSGHGSALLPPRPPAPPSTAQPAETHLAYDAAAGLPPPGDASLQRPQEEQRGQLPSEQGAPPAAALQPPAGSLASQLAPAAAAAAAPASAPPPPPPPPHQQQAAEVSPWDWAQLNGALVDAGFTPMMLVDAAVGGGGSGTSVAAPPGARSATHDFDGLILTPRRRGGGGTQQAVSQCVRACACVWHAGEGVPEPSAVLGTLRAVLHQYTRRHKLVTDLLAATEVAADNEARLQQALRSATSRCNRRRPLNHAPFLLLRTRCLVHADRVAVWRHVGRRLRAARAVRRDAQREVAVAQRAAERAQQRADELSELQLPRARSELQVRHGRALPCRQPCPCLCYRTARPACFAVKGLDKCCCAWACGAARRPTCPRRRRRRPSSRSSSRSARRSSPPRTPRCAGGERACREGRAVAVVLKTPSARTSG